MFLLYFLDNTFSAYVPTRSYNSAPSSTPRWQIKYLYIHIYIFIYIHIYIYVAILHLLYILYLLLHHYFHISLVVTTISGMVCCSWIGRAENPFVDWNSSSAICSWAVHHASALIMFHCFTSAVIIMWKQQPSWRAKTFNLSSLNNYTFCNSDFCSHLFIYINKDRSITYMNVRIADREQRNKINFLY